MRFEEESLKKLMFITLGDKKKLDNHIRDNRYRNIKDNIEFAKQIGYQVSQSSMHRYMVGLRGGESG